MFTSLSGVEIIIGQMSWGREKTTACVWIQAKVQNMKPTFLSNFKIKYKCQMDFSIVASGPPKISCRRVMKIEEFQGVDISYEIVV